MAENIRLKEVDGKICTWYLLNHNKVTVRDAAIIRGVLEDMKLRAPLEHDEDCNGLRDSCLERVDFEEIYVDFMLRANAPQGGNENKEKAR
jgi:hypothetical protein